MEKKEKFGKLRELGLKLTPQRLAILDFLDGNTSHPSAEEIYANVSRSFPSMSFATVYNTLDALRERGQIVELNLDPAKKRFDPNTKPHHHLVCASCYKIVDVMRDYRVRIPPEERSGFRLQGKQITFIGTCPECQAAEAPAEAP
ncbi:transcriptional repressor [Dissulfurirhabdus thermomarina]|uniref:Transcriptional repressor n=1 Tax=Dissulfurirhabdus thermomarina TaxID=1765737 RepID=A0A6N9TU02_DISTH|nr:Fur family transcriptional regulator [Dissulfurirhabdus thermomarina]NDY43224.1 transcriptional repressor [Dissulfurirhabdus thermomarina]